MQDQAWIKFEGANQYGASFRKKHNLDFFWRFWGQLLGTLFGSTPQRPEHILCVFSRFAQNSSYIVGPLWTLICFNRWHTMTNQFRLKKTWFDKSNTETMRFSFYSVGRSCAKWWSCHFPNWGCDHMMRTLDPSVIERHVINPDLTSAPASTRTKDVIPPVWTLFGSCWNTAQIRCQVALLLGSVCFLLGSGCAKILGHLKFHLSQKGICLWYVVTQFVVEDESPFLVSMIHASRTFWTNCFFALCVTQIFEITQEAYDKVSQGLFLTKSLQLPAKKKKNTTKPTSFNEEHPWWTGRDTFDGGIDYPMTV